ncbi:hypothetical protein LCGC14_2836210, partial [marine sediment metagenome]
MPESKYVSGRDGTSRGSYTLVTDAGAEIKTAYEAEANAYTDTKNTKLGGIATNATKYPDTGEQAFLDAEQIQLDGIP